VQDQGFFHLHPAEVGRGFKGAQEFGHGEAVMPTGPVGGFGASTPGTEYQCQGNCHTMASCSRRSSCSRLASTLLSG
jgi:hypothetical protein